MPSEVILPRVDMDMTTGKISKWLVAPGATVKKGQPLFEIETDKAAMEIEADASGTIRDLVEPGEGDLAVGSVVAWIDAEGEAPPRPGAVAPTQAQAVPPAQGETVPPPVEARVADRSEPTAGRPRATPLARRLARERGLTLSSLPGSGPRGRVQAGDVERHAAPAAAAVEPRIHRSAAAPASVPAVPPPVPVRPVAGRDAAPLSLVRLREGEGTPIMLLHGFGADADGWRPMLAGYGARRPVLALDLPGHGASPLGAAADFGALVDAVEAALLASGVPAMTLVGHSLGGAVAAAVAARGAVDVRALLLLSPAGLGPEINGGFIAGYLGATSEASLGAWMRELVSEPGPITPAVVRATLRTREATTASQRRVAEAVFPDGTQAFSIRPDLAGIRVPTRVVFGTADRIIPPRHALGLPGLVALHGFAGVGHMPQWEARDGVLAILSQMAAA